MEESGFCQETSSLLDTDASGHSCKGSTTIDTSIRFSDNPQDALLQVIQFFVAAFIYGLPFGNGALLFCFKHQHEATIQELMALTSSQPPSGAASIAGSTTMDYKYPIDAQLVSTRSLWLLASRPAKLLII